MDVSRRRVLIWLAGAGLTRAALAEPDLLKGFSPFPDAGGFEGKRVWTVGEGPAVLFLHELPGLMTQAVDFVRRLSGTGFKVYMPLFFGKPGQFSNLRVVLRTPCWGAEFDCASRHSLGNVVHRTARLCAAIDQAGGNKGIGVIGNCLTGAVPLALMADVGARPRLKCAVVAQPALPMGVFGAPCTRAGRTAVGLTHDQLRAAADSNVPLLALRIVGDKLVPEDRLLGLKKAFEGKPFEYYPVPQDAHCHKDRDESAGHTHASLTMAYCGANSNGRKAFEKVVGFLKSNLSRG